MTALWDDPMTAAEPSHRGTKRQSNEVSTDTQRITKRLRTLNLNPSSKYPPSVSSPNANSESHREKDHSSDNESMQVEDTSHRIYIHDIEQELSDAVSREESENRLIFVPEIERKLAKLPANVLIGEEEREKMRLEESRKGNELVLYHVPSSLTLPKEQDSVRKAILESRARLRNEQPLAGSSQDSNSDQWFYCNSMHQPRGGGALVHDPPLISEDVMDIS